MNPELVVSIHEKAVSKMFNKAWHTRSTLLICEESWDYIAANISTNAWKLAGLSLNLIDEEKEQIQVRIALIIFFSNGCNGRFEILSQQEIDAIQRRHRYV